MAELFISYSRRDAPHALDLVADLRAEGYSVWIDQGGIEGAQNWSSRIVEGINDCCTLVLLISPHSLGSHNVAREVQLALEKGKNILPVIIEQASLPSNFEYSLAGLQQVSYFDRTAILKALEMLRSGAPVAQLPEQSVLSDEEESFIRVAVLPFDDLSPQHDNQWFADGMMDELIGTLGHLELVKVPSRSDVLHYREHRAKSRVIARELGVRYLVEGAVRKAGERIRINATLTDSRQGEQLWGNQFDGTFEDVFNFQESVARQVTEALKLHLTPKDAEHIEARVTQNVEAYELFLKGRHEQYYYSKESFIRALDLYEKAAAIDPKFERAYVGIASICCVYYREYSKDLKWLQRAESSLAKAEQIAGETSRTLYIRGMIEWMKGGIQQAIDFLNRSVVLDPTYPNTLNVLGAIHMANGDFVDAAMAFQRVTDLGEDTMAYFNLLGALDNCGDSESVRLRNLAQKALPVFERYLLREPGDSNAAVSKGFVLHWAGRNAEAMEMADQLFSADNLGGQVKYRLGTLYQILGKPQLYLALLREAIGSGYRELEQTRQFFETENPALKREFQTIITELEETIEREKSSSPA